MTAGSAVLMWIGEQITEKGVGNGISIVLTINIISGMPSDIANTAMFLLSDGARWITGQNIVVDGGYTSR